MQRLKVLTQLSVNKINANCLRLYQDYNIKESILPKKTNYLSIPQKSVQVYDCINNTTKVVKPPYIQLEKYSNFKDNYYKAFISAPKPFNKGVGYFNFF